MAIPGPQRRYAGPRGQNRYSAVRCPCEQGGEPHTHDSLAERNRCFVLTQRERLGEIRDLRRHTRWPLEVNGRRVGVYTDDFNYVLADGTFVIEDVKAPPTRRETAYRLRKRVFEAYYGFVVNETE